MHGTDDKDAQDVRIYDNLKQIKNVIMVLSGKGGVGKSTVSVNLAHSLAMAGNKVGIMDVDIHGPNIPKMLGIEDRHFSGQHEAIEPVEILPNFHAASIGLVGYDPNEALIWRGPMKIGLVRQFLGDVVWGDLDYLVIDTPPGTGDEALTTAQLIPQMKGAVIVTSPQDVSILDSRKSMTFASKLNLPILGIIENMSGFVCSHCGQISDIFGKGGGQAASDAVGVPFLGAVPIDPGIVVAGDQGRPFLAQFPERPAAIAFKEIIENIARQIEKNTADGIYEGKEPEDPRVVKERKKNQIGDFRPLQ
jgi:ATP-binding protein involved in chromosome partitioning